MAITSRQKHNNVTKEGLTQVTITKSHQDSSKSFVSPDFSKKESWYYQAVEVVDEVATTSDELTYSFASGKTVIDLKQVTDREDWQHKGIAVKKNDVIITTGFTITPSTNSLLFDSANQPSDTIKVSYSYENGSAFCLEAAAGKKILLDYVETQFSANCTFNDTLVFELLLNNPNTGNNEVVVGKNEYYMPQDFLNKGNNGSVMEPFGGLTKKINIFPWNYLTGYTFKPVGDPTTDPSKNEFNGAKMYLKSNTPYTDCEIATGTLYCRIEDL